MQAVAHFIETFVPEHYDIFLDLNREQKTFTGKVSISGEAKGEKISLHQTNELLTKVNVLVDDINVKVATIDPLFTAVADLSVSVSDLNEQARVLSKKASSAGSKTIKTGAGLSAIRVASKFFKK